MLNSSSAQQGDEATDRLQWLIRRPIAHRGLHDLQRGIPENSMAAFAAAIEHGYAIECDLQVSADGDAMVFHDDTLDRLTTRPGRVDQVTAACLSDISLIDSSERIPRLSDLLALCAGAVTLVLELKSHWNGDDRLTRRTVDLLRDYAGPAAVMSFDPRMVQQLKELAPDLVRGIVADGTWREDWRHRPLFRRWAQRFPGDGGGTLPDFVSYDARGLPSPASRSFRAAGRPVICWTVRSERQARRALRFCDQITFEGFRP